MKIVSIISTGVVPVFVAIIIIHGLVKKVDIYDAFVAGAKRGISMVFRIMPYVVGMIFAIEIFRASGCFDYISGALTPVLSVVGIPAEIIPLALMRPFSGGGSFGLLAGMYARYGPDSYIGRVSSTYMGSSETLFYTVSLYFGSIGITKTRYVIPVALFTDFLGLILSCLLCRWMF